MKTGFLVTADDGFTYFCRIETEAISLALHYHTTKNVATVVYPITFGQEIVRNSVPAEMRTEGTE